MENDKANNIMNMIGSWLVILLLVAQLFFSILIVMKLDTYISLAVRAMSSNTQTTIAQSSIDKPLQYFGQISIGDSPIDGDIGKAKVVIVEFGDFECSYCAQTHEIIKTIRAQYGNDVAFVFKNFPLSSIHSQALKAAEAAHCAEDQGKYWEMHNLLFTDQQHLEISDLKDKAQKLGLDTNKFNQCLESGKHEKSILDNMQEAEKLMLNGNPLIAGTPTLIVNGYYVEPNQLISIVEKFITEGDEKSTK